MKLHVKMKEKENNTLQNMPTSQNMCIDVMCIRFFYYWNLTEDLAGNWP